jgi:hypothetical protein
MEPGKPARFPITSMVDLKLMCGVYYLPRGRVMNHLSFMEKTVVSYSYL